VRKTIDKSEVRRLEMDIEIDKYLRAALLSEDPERRVFYLEKSIEKHPASSKTRRLMFHSYLANCQIEKAESVESLYGGDAAVALGILELKRGRLSQAKSILEKALRHRLSVQDSSSARAALAFSLAMLSDLDGAAKSLKSLSNTEGLSSPIPFTARATVGSVLGMVQAFRHSRTEDRHSNAMAFLRHLNDPIGLQTNVLEEFLRERERVDTLERPATTNTRRMSLSIEILGGGLFSLAWDLDRRAPWSLGLAAGMDTEIAAIPDSGAGPTLVYASVFAKWNPLAKRVSSFLFGTRFHVGASVFSMPGASPVAALEFNPSLQVGFIYLYITFSLLALISFSGVDPALFPQIGFGYRI
jgi:hypothetical protein